MGGQLSTEMNAEEINGQSKAQLSRGRGNKSSAFSLSLTEEVIDAAASSSEALNNDVILHSQEAQQDIQPAMGMTGKKRLPFRA
ncbi:uncharacterized protein FTOL_12430 [Fusarium torulosum]|uniref:Uncharacterized protein n=1 Tax=Fusarium torulosum TaxID=33205 RepID=A0AAE8MKV0_9HYPO|nr:uncharacterized protein FTOL_12430 [Fusarium torulosum]